MSSVPGAHESFRIARQRPARMKEEEKKERPRGAECV